MPALVFPTVDGKEAGRWAPDGRGNGTHIPTDFDPELEKKIQLLLEVGEECQTETELRNLVKKKPEFILYDGFEPSGRMHIAQGVFKAINVNKCTAAGGIFKFWVADWFALMNDKMGGDLDKIKVVGKYLIEVWKATGMNMEKVEFLWTSDEIEKHAESYWLQMLDITRLFNMTRIKKCCQIMGRGEDKLTAAQILYPIMQCTDIFHLKADICQLGVDQRKVNMLARDYCDASKRKLKPIILSHHMLYGLAAGQAKMSKSDPDSAVFMEDTAADVRRKILKAYCPLKPEDPDKQDNSMSLVEDTLKNPIIDYCKFIIFSNPGTTLAINGVTYNSAEEVKEAWCGERIPEADLKEAVINKLNNMLDAVRSHFSSNKEAAELLNLIMSYKKDALVPEPTVRCLKVFEQPKGYAVVFVPLPAGNQYKLTFDFVLSTLKGLVAAVDSQPQVALWLEDWSSFCLNKFGGDHKVIAAFYLALEEALKVMAPEVMKKVTVMHQSKEILKDPNMYWISVIDVGRKHNLEQIRSALPAGSSLEQAGQVVSTLMNVADVLAISNVGSSNVPVEIICQSSDVVKRVKLATTYIKDFLLEADRAKENKLSVPVVVDLDERATSSGVEVAYRPNPAYSLNLIIGEADNFINTYVKQAYCFIPKDGEEGKPDVEQNPCLDIIKTFVACKLIPADAVLQVKRKPENGGDETFASIKAMVDAFVDGKLHPGDMKAAVKDSVKAAMAPLFTAYKGNAVLKKAIKDMETFDKKMKKAKK